VAIKLAVKIFFPGPNARVASRALTYYDHCSPQS
jgi:hypothetical protein